MPLIARFLRPVGASRHFALDAPSSTLQELNLAVALIVAQTSIDWVSGSS